MISITPAVLDGACESEGLGCKQEPCRARFLLYSFVDGDREATFCDGRNPPSCIRVSLSGGSDVREVELDVACNSTEQISWQVGSLHVFSWGECTLCKKEQESGGGHWA